VGGLVVIGSAGQLSVLSKNADAQTVSEEIGKFK